MDTKRADAAKEAADGTTKNPKEYVLGGNGWGRGWREAKTIRASSCCNRLANRRDGVFSHQLIGLAKVGHWDRLPSGDLRNFGMSQRLLRRTGNWEARRLEVRRLLT